MENGTATNEDATKDDTTLGCNFVKFADNRDTLGIVVQDSHSRRSNPLVRTLRHFASSELLILKSRILGQ